MAAAPAEPKGWLGDSLQRLHPGHAWIKRLGTPPGNRR
jgi:hypothetical protein